MNKVFENITLVCIVLSSVLLVIDNPLYDPESIEMKIVKYMDLVFTVLFFFEAMIKIIAKGLVFNSLGPIQPYMRSYWNMLDGFVVAASLVDLIFMILKIDMQQLQALKALRALRALRPLRVISKDEGMKLIVNALLASIPSMSNVLLVCSLFILIFSIMGVNFFKGTFYHCQDKPGALILIDMDTVFTKEDCINGQEAMTFANGTSVAYRPAGLWINKSSTFDNTIEAMSTLFQMMTTEGWVDVMQDGIDNTGLGNQPK